MRQVSAIFAANIVAVGFLALAALFVYKGMEGWGWCILGAIITKSELITTYTKKEN